MNTGLNRTKWEPYVWLLPSILLIAIFVVFPILIVFKLSFSEISKAGVIGGFIGFDNYVEAVHLPAFKTVMLNTLWWVLSVVILSTLLGFIIAMVLNQKFHGQKIARAIMVFPWATSLVIQASVWNYIIKAEYGNLNNILLNLGIIRQAINWRSSYQIEFVWECWVGIFVTVPFVTFCVLSGLQSIDGSLYEAATMDGAGFWHKLRHITLPMVKPSLTVSTVLNIIYVFNSFPIVYTMTKGAPAHKTDTMITYLYMRGGRIMRKITRGLALVLVGMTLSGCGKNIVLNEKQTGEVAEYSTGLTLKYARNYTDVLIYSTEVPEATAEPGADENQSTPNPNEATSTDNPGTEGETTGAQILDDIYKVKGIQFSVKGVDTMQTFKESANAGSALYAKKGNKLAIVSVKMHNTLKKEKRVYLLEKGVNYNLRLKDGSTYDAELSIMNSDLNFYNGKVAAGKSKIGNLFFQIPKKASLKGAQLLVTGDNGELTVDLP